MREFIRSDEVLEVIDQYRSELTEEMKGRQADFRLQHKLAALRSLETRIRLLSRGGLKVIQGGRKKEGSDP